MTPEEEPSPSKPSAGPPRPRRRSRRGGRGRKRPAPGAGAASSELPAASEPVGTFSDVDATESEPLPDSKIEEPFRDAAESSADERRELLDDAAFEPPHELPEPIRPAHVERGERRDFKPASPVAVTEAIEEVNQVITSLKQVLDTMEEILETLELAEVQKTADEREIQSLRNALRNVDRRVVEPRRERSEEPRGDQRGPDRPDRRGRR